MTRLFLIFTLVELLSGCKHDVRENCLSDEFYKHIENNYIGNGVWLYDHFGDTLKRYINVYFFQKESDNYFTVWSSPYPASIYIENSKFESPVLYGFERRSKYLNRIFIIDHNEAVRDFYKICSSNVDTAQIMLKGSDYSGNFDGSTNPVTYKYQLNKKGKSKFEKQKIFIADFLSDSFTQKECILFCK